MRCMDCQYWVPIGMMCQKKPHYHTDNFAIWTDCSDGKLIEGLIQKFLKHYLMEIEDIKIILNSLINHLKRDGMVEIKNTKLDLSESLDVIKMKMKDRDVQQMARQLHEFYLEVVPFLKEGSFNPDAVRPFDELTESQKFIDLYIATRLICTYFIWNE